MKYIRIVVLLLCSCSPKQKPTETFAGDTVSMPVKRYDSLSRTTCLHTNLSRSFDIEVLFERYRGTKENLDSCSVRLRIADKNTKELLDSVSMNGRFYFGDVFKDCSTVRSYRTKINIDKLVADNNFGDIVIADLNFDDRDDMAVINDSGGTSGTFYSYYLQEANRRFTYNPYLTDSVMHFPEEINPKTRTLVTYGLAGTCGIGEHVYQFNKGDGSWRQKSHRVIGVCK